MATKKRLIDANEFLNWLVKRFHCIPLVGSSDLNSESMKFLLSQAPTVDAVEVVHGRWVIEKRKTLSRNPYMDDNYHAHATCSECGFCIHSENASFGYPKLNTTNYCPNCGAKMDGGINK